MAKKKAKTRRLPGLAFLAMCDAVSRDPATGKVSLYGVFDQVISQTFPATAALSGYAKLIDGSGKHSVKMQFLDDKGAVIKNGEREVEIDFQNQPVELNMQFVPVVFPKPGKYSFRIVVDNVPLGQQYTLGVVRHKKH